MVVADVTGVAVAVGPPESIPEDPSFVAPELITTEEATVGPELAVVFAGTDAGILLAPPAAAPAVW